MLSTCSRWGVTSLLLGVLAAGCGLGGVNNSPVVLVGPTAMPNDVFSGSEVQMELEVADKDGDALSYTWIQAPTEPAGTFSDTHVREPRWTAPEVTEPTSFLLKVNTQDGEGGALLSWTTVQVRPRRQ